jgi:hypothetical protein
MRISKGLKLESKRTSSQPEVKKLMEKKRRENKL